MSKYEVSLGYMRSRFKTKTLRQKHKDYIHDVLHGSARFTGKQAESIHVLEKQNKAKQNLYILGPYPNTLFTFKGGGLVNLMYKRSTQPSIQGYSMGIIGCFYPDLQ